MASKKEQGGSYQLPVYLRPGHLMGQNRDYGNPTQQSSPASTQEKKATPGFSKPEKPVKSATGRTASTPSAKKSLPKFTKPAQSVKSATERTAPKQTSLGNPKGLRDLEKPRQTSLGNPKGLRDLEKPKPKTNDTVKRPAPPARTPKGPAITKKPSAPSNKTKQYENAFKYTAPSKAEQDRMRKQGLKSASAQNAMAQARKASEEARKKAGRR